MPRLDGHQLFVGPVPHLYPLVRLIDQNPRYAALLVDTNHARIIVFGLGAVESRDDVQQRADAAATRWAAGRRPATSGTPRTSTCSTSRKWSRRSQRIVRDDGIDRVIVAGDAGLVARLRDQLPPPLDAKIVDVLRFDRHAGEDEIVEDALAALRERDAEDDAPAGGRGARTRGAAPDSAWPVRTRRCARWSSGRWTSC